MGVKNFILAPAIDLIIAQRLVRRLCECAEEKPMTETEKGQIESLVQSATKKGIEMPAIPQTLKRPKGCNKCGQTGYAGQVAIAEVLRFNQELRDLILEGKPMPEVHAYINEHCKMLTLQEDGVLKVVKGITTLEEVYRVTA
jgi:type II secretory ATPase GspE/PulE/Tfp pilus assembly ATPase PilB-like protein